MQYWIILGVLAAIAVALIIIIITVLVKGGKSTGDYEYDDDYTDEEDMYDDDEDEYEPPRRAGKARQAAPEAPVRAASAPKAPVKKQWKIILENLDTWEKYTFVFYDNIGIGRGKKTPEFEKYITVQDDPRVSKLHCAIVRNEDKLYLKDMGARNGTYLNGRQVQRPVVLQKEDVIGVGETKIEVKKILREKD